MRKAGKVVWRLMRRLGSLAGRMVNDSDPSRKPPPGNFIPNSNGEGGRVISSGHPGGNA